MAIVPNPFPWDGEPAWALYHASFREFLAERLDMHAIRERIGTAIENAVP